MSNFYDLKGGVLIIGSLLWQDHLHYEGDNIRLNWRNSNLDMDNKIAVHVPIRYGRKSQSGIPTTVFSKMMETKLGCAYVVPFKNKINNATQLTKECVALSAVEGLKGNFTRKWGVLTYLFNEEQISLDNREVISDLFKNRRHLNIDIKQYLIGSEKSCLKNDLSLNIDWINPIDSSDEFKLNKIDFLLATATKPNIKTLNEVTDGIKADKSRYYYVNNQCNGIITGSDVDISKLL